MGSCSQCVKCIIYDNHHVCLFRIEHTISYRIYLSTGSPELTILTFDVYHITSHLWHFSQGWWTRLYRAAWSESTRREATSYWWRTTPPSKRQSRFVNRLSTFHRLKLALLCDQLVSFSQGYVSRSEWVRVNSPLTLARKCRQIGWYNYDRVGFLELN